jgi:hypothetical protein
MIINKLAEPDKKIYVEGVKFMPDTPVDSYRRVESGLEFILSHCSGPQFPRKIMVATIEGQREISDKDRTMLYYHCALWVDCRVSAFYPGQKNPDLIFIDIDAKDFCSERALKTALTKILKSIKKKIGGHPTIIWSGRGYHVIQPIDCQVNLDNVDKLIPLVRDKDVNKAFLQFGARYLSNGKKDKDNRTSLTSCQLRIPGYRNARCIEEGIDPEVKIIQEWDGHRPDFRLLLGSFYADLVAKREQERKERERYLRLHPQTFENGHTTTTIGWIETLLRTSLDDHRRYCADLIIITYLIVRRGMTDEDQIMSIVMQWADRCDELDSLRPKYRVFERRVRRRIRSVLYKESKIPPVSWSRLLEENPELAKKLSAGGGV